jgi:hypothetical protein
MPDMNYIPGNQEPRQQPMGPPAYPTQQFAPILPPKKKHTTRNVLLIVLAGLVALCGVGTIVAATTSSGKAGYQAATSPTVAESGHIKPGQQDPNIAITTQAAQPPAPPRQPVTVTGSGNSTKTAQLTAGGYTVDYKATKKGGDMAFLIVEVISKDGTSQGSFVNDSSRSTTLTGSTTINAQDTNTYLFKVSNAEDETWSLTFTPIG